MHNMKKLTLSLFILASTVTGFCQQEATSKRSTANAKPTTQPARNNRPTTTNPEAAKQVRGGVIAVDKTVELKRDTVNATGAASNKRSPQ